MVCNDQNISSGLAKLGEYLCDLFHMDMIADDSLVLRTRFRKNLVGFKCTKWCVTFFFPLLITLLFITKISFMSGSEGFGGGGVKMLFFL